MMKASKVETAKELIDEMQAIGVVLRSIGLGGEVEISSDLTAHSVTLPALNEIVSDALKSRLDAIRTELVEMGVELDFQPDDEVTLSERFSAAMRKVDEELNSGDMAT